MRRNDKRIDDPALIETIMRKARVCRIALADANVPYVVPMNFGFRGNVIYLHSAREGRKIDILSRNDLVCFEVDTDLEIVTGEAACSWGAKYYSVIGNGKASIVTEPGEKRFALDAIMEKYSGKPEWDYGPAALDRVTVIRIDLTDISGKKSGR
jgi:nitroimidazol reductase NimA-like FMN-containing flavoprotein (pyridoxamine 5'-phosphate oxidase superfamily)